MAVSAEDEDELPVISRRSRSRSGGVRLAQMQAAAQLQLAAAKARLTPTNTSGEQQQTPTAMDTTGEKSKPRKVGDVAAEIDSGFESAFGPRARSLVRTDSGASGHSTHRTGSASGSDPSRSTSQTGTGSATNLSRYNPGLQLMLPASGGSATEMSDELGSPLHTPINHSSFVIPIFSHPGLERTTSTLSQQPQLQLGRSLSGLNASGVSVASTISARSSASSPAPPVRSIALRSLIKAMMQREPGQRPSIQQILHHPNVVQFAEMRRTTPRRELKLPPIVEAKPPPTVFGTSFVQLDFVPFDCECHR